MIAWKVCTARKTPLKYLPHFIPYCFCVVQKMKIHRGFSLNTLLFANMSLHLRLRWHRNREGQIDIGKYLCFWCADTKQNH